jgi:hypothetical protein
MNLSRIKKIAILLVLVTLSYLLAWEAEKAARRTPGMMLPHWRIRYFRNHTKKSRTIPDAQIGFLMAPHLADEIRTPDFTFVRSTDSKGFPNRDPWPKQADIVFLGDSLIVGEGVALQRSFSQLISNMLPDRQIVNLGIPAAGPERQHATFQRFGAALRPALVVSCLYLASDFGNDDGFRAWLRIGQNFPYNDYRLRYRRLEEPAWSLDRVFERSWLLGMAQELVNRALGGQDYPRDRYRFPNGTEVWFDREVVEFASQPAALNDARVETMVGSVQKLRDLALRQNARLAVVLIPSKEELFAVDDAARKGNIVARTRQRLREANLPILDLYPAIQEGGARHSPYFQLDIHLNEYGNRIVAHQFISWFQTRAQEFGL